MSTHQADAYLVIKATRGRYGYDNPEDRASEIHSIEKLRIDRVTLGRPAKLGADEVAIKVGIVVNDALFQPPKLAALIHVPDALAIPGIAVELSDPYPPEDTTP